MSANCHNHPEVNSVFRCDACQRYFCAACVKTVPYSEEAVYRVCLNCGGKCVELEQEEKEILEKVAFAVSFWTELPKIFTYPFRKGGGWIILWTGLYFGLLFYILVTLLRIRGITCCTDEQNVLSAPIYFFLSVFLGSLFGLLTYLQGIVFATAGGGDEPTDWYTINFFGRLFLFGTWLTAGLITFFLWVPLKHFIDNGVHNPAAPAAFVAGLLLFPLLYIRLALKEDTSAFSPPDIVRNLRAFVWEYGATVVSFLVIGGILYNSIMFCFYHFKPSTAASIQFVLMPFTIYLLMAMMRLWGLFGRVLEAENP